MLWNVQQVNLIKEFLTQEAPKLIKKYFVGADINDEVIDKLTFLIRDELRRVFDKRIDIRAQCIMPDRTYTIYLIQNDTQLLELITGTL